MEELTFCFIAILFACFYLNHRTQNKLSYMGTEQGNWLEQVLQEAAESPAGMRGECYWYLVGRGQGCCLTT